jgi:hypothetical protein
LLEQVALGYRAVFGAPVHEEIVDGSVLHQAFLVQDGLVELELHEETDMITLSVSFCIALNGREVMHVSHSTILKDGVVRIRLAGSSELASFQGIEEVLITVRLPQDISPVQVFTPGLDGPVPLCLNLTNDQVEKVKSWVAKLIGSVTS